VLAASDSAALGTKVDAALLVVRAGSSQRAHVSRAKEALERVHVRMIGAVLSNAPRESNSVRYG
jgi:Mrp family chromosome partitioning ATPase